MHKVIVIDPNRDIWNLCQRLISDRQCLVMMASSEREGFELAKAEAPDLILITVDEYENDRLEDIRSRSLKLKTPVPIVLLSKRVTPEYETQIMDSGILDVIRLEFGSEEIYSKIRKILGSNGKKLGANHDAEYKLLIVDDEKIILTLLEEFFSKKNIKTFCAENGSEAIEIVKKEKPDVVLLDIIMPGMDGIQTLQEIRKIDSNIGVVMASGLSDEKVACQAIRLGAYDYVTKPFDMRYLDRVVLTRLSIAS